MTRKCIPLFFLFLITWMLKVDSTMGCEPPTCRCTVEEEPQCCDPGISTHQCCNSGDTFAYFYNSSVSLLHSKNIMFHQVDMAQEQ